MRITKRQLKSIIREEYQKITRQKKLIESAKDNFPWIDRTPPPDRKLVKLGKLILSGDLESMRQGIILGEDAGIIKIDEYEDREAPYTRYKGMQPETHQVFKVEFTTSQEFHDLLRKIYADIPKDSDRRKNWQSMISVYLGGLSKEPIVEISFSNNYEFWSKMWTNQGKFQTFPGY